jgi:hypothetical protein
LTEPSGSWSCSSRAVANARSASSLRSRASGESVKGRSRRVRHCAGNLALGSAQGSTNALTRWAPVELGCHAQERRRRPGPIGFPRDASRPRLQPISAQDRHRYPACPRAPRARPIQNGVFQPQIGRKPGKKCADGALCMGIQELHRGYFGRNASSRQSQEVASLRGESSNQLLEILEEWSDYLERQPALVLQERPP